MLSNLFKTKVNVDFIDADNNKIFAKSKMPIDQLPKSFAIATTMHLNNEDWQVVSATPASYEEIKKSKYLQLVLKKVTYIKTSDILYTIPTLSKDAIDLNGIHFVTNSDIEAVFIHPDDWRQTEFIARELRVAVDREFENINSIYQTQSKNGGLTGYKHIHIRSTIESPLLDKGLTPQELLLFFKVYQKKHIAFPEPQNVISNGFFYVLSEQVSLYGITNDNNIIKCLGIMISSMMDEATMASIVNFSNKYNLIAVDWIRMTMIDNVS